MVLRSSKRKITGGVRQAGRRVSPREGHENAELVIITGISGSGKAAALKAFEDLGYYSVHNLPVELIPRVAELAVQAAEIRRPALVGDVREGPRPDQLP